MRNILQLLILLREHYPMHRHKGMCLTTCEMTKCEIITYEEELKLDDYISDWMLANPDKCENTAVIYPKYEIDLRVKWLKNAIRREKRKVKNG